MPKVQVHKKALVFSHTWWAPVGSDSLKSAVTRLVARKGFLGRIFLDNKQRKSGGCGFACLGKLRTVSTLAVPRQRHRQTVACHVCGGLPLQDSLWPGWVTVGASQLGYCLAEGAVRVLFAGESQASHLTVGDAEVTCSVVVLECGTSLPVLGPTFSPVVFQISGLRCCKRVTSLPASQSGRGKPGTLEEGD